MMPPPPPLFLMPLLLNPSTLKFLEGKITAFPTQTPITHKIEC